MWWRQATERQRMFGVLIRMMQFLFGEIEPKTNKIIYKSICEHTFIFGCLLFAVAGEKIIYSIYANSRTLAKCQMNIGPVWWFLYDMVPLWTFPPPNKHLRLLSAAFFFYFSQFYECLVWIGCSHRVEEYYYEHIFSTNRLKQTASNSQTMALPIILPF